MRYDGLLTVAEAAEMLQPHMPSRNARAWLDSDRRFCPVISFLMLDGEIYYRQPDVMAFIRGILMPKPAYGVPERRRHARSGLDRRRRVGVTLHPAAERRRGSERRVQVTA